MYPSYDATLHLITPVYNWCKVDGISISPPSLTKQLVDIIKLSRKGIPKIIHEPEILLYTISINM